MGFNQAGKVLIGHADAHFFMLRKLPEGPIPIVDLYRAWQHLISHPDGNGEVLSPLTEETRVSPIIDLSGNDEDDEDYYSMASHHSKSPTAAPSITGKTDNQSSYICLIPTTSTIH